MPNPIYGAKNNFIGNLVNNSKPFSIGTNPVPDLYGIMGKKNLFGDTRPTTPANIISPTGGTAPIPSPAPAKTQYVNNMATTPVGANANRPFNENVSGPAGTPSPVAPTAPNAYKSAFDEYIKSLQPSTAEIDAGNNLAGLQTKNKFETYDPYFHPGSTTGFAGAEAERANRDNSLAIDSASNALNAFGAQRTANSDMAKARYDYEKSILPSDKSQDGFSLSPGQTRYDASGKAIASLPKDPSGLAKPLKLTATQADSLTGFDNTAGAAQDALNLLAQGISTGPIAGRILQGAKFFGTQDEKQLQLEQNLAKLKADFMKAISGAAVSESEAKRLAAFLPEITDQESVIKTKLETLMKESARTKQNLLNTIQQSGGTTSSGIQRSQVLTSPQGQVFDASDLTDEEYQEALDDGYKSQ